MKQLACIVLHERSLLPFIKSITYSKSSLFINKKCKI